MGGPSSPRAVAFLGGWSWDVEESRLNKQGEKGSELLHGLRFSSCLQAYVMEDYIHGYTRLTYLMIDCKLPSLVSKPSPLEVAFGDGVDHSNRNLSLQSCPPEPPQAGLVPCFV